MGLAPRIGELDRFIDRELEAIKQAADQAETDRNTWDTLNRYFMKQVTDRPVLNPYELQPSIGIDLGCLDKIRQSKWKNINRIERNRN